jgi:hypothetical protein
MEPKQFSQLVRCYAEILNPLFWSEDFLRSDRLFEYVCTLVRAGGVQDAGWDSYHESQAILDDLKNLADLELPKDKFQDVERTRIRLALLSYCHVTEMNLPYVLLANLFGLRFGRKYCISPFADLGTPLGGKKAKGLLRKLKTACPPSEDKAHQGIC